MPVSFSDAARKAVVSVVNISATKQVRRRSPLQDDPVLRRFFGERFNIPETQLSLGSGVIVSREGFVLTNSHVVEGVTEIRVTLNDGRTVPGRIVGADPETDLAVVRIAAQGLTPITFGQSDRLQVGDVVLAIGDPFSVGQTVTMGIVSAVGREIGAANPFGSFIQTDAAINPGNSGGALVDAQGNLVGINTLIYSRSGGYQGIGFAIPVGLARKVMEQIIETGVGHARLVRRRGGQHHAGARRVPGARRHARGDRRRHRARQPRGPGRNPPRRRDRRCGRPGRRRPHGHPERDRRHPARARPCR